MSRTRLNTFVRKLELFDVYRRLGAEFARELQPRPLGRADGDHPACPPFPGRPRPPRIPIGPEPLNLSLKATRTTVGVSKHNSGADVDVADLKHSSSEACSEILKPPGTLEVLKSARKGAPFPSLIARAKRKEGPRSRPGAGGSWDF